MLTTLLLLTSTVGPSAVQPANQDPPVHVWYNSDGDYTYGDRAKVYARAAESGFLVVLRVDNEGNVRVLAPLDPGDDQHVNAGKKYELKGRGGREAFVTEDTTAQGIVMAAWSNTPFNFDRFEKDGRWDLGALSGSGAQPASEDPEARLLDIVHEMQATGGHFDYDVATYTVTQPEIVRAYYPYPYGRGWGYDPWWGWGPAFGGRVFVGHRVVLGGRWLVR